MSWYAWMIVGYFVLDRVATIAMIDRSIRITRMGAVLSLISGSLITWAVIVMAGGCS